MKLDISDLKPTEAILKLSDHPDKDFVLKKISLATRIWLKENFEEAALPGIFENKNLSEISKIAYQLLKDKQTFPTLESFQEAIVTHADFVALVQAMLTTIGISEPVYKRLVQEAEAEGKVDAPLTGAQSTT